MFRTAIVAGILAMGAVLLIWGSTGIISPWNAMVFLFLLAVLAGLAGYVMGVEEPREDHSLCEIGRCVHCTPPTPPASAEAWPPAGRHHRAPMYEYDRHLL